MLSLLKQLKTTKADKLQNLFTLLAYRKRTHVENALGKNFVAKYPMGIQLILANIDGEFRIINHLSKDVGNEPFAQSLKDRLKAVGKHLNKGESVFINLTNSLSNIEIRQGLLGSKLYLLKSIPARVLPTIQIDVMAGDGIEVADFVKRCPDLVNEFKFKLLEPEELLHLIENAPSTTCFIYCAGEMARGKVVRPTDMFIGFKYSYGCAKYEYEL